MESKSEELKCPVCGNYAHDECTFSDGTINDIEAWWVECNDYIFCGLEGPRRDTREEAIAAWKRLWYGDNDGILISRRTFMMLPIEERRRIMEEQAEELAAAGYGEEE